MQLLRSALHLVLLAIVLIGVARAEEARKPTLFLIGDSTVKNNTRGQVGWGTPLRALFDEKKIRVENRALGGRSSRSFLREGLWEKVLDDVKPGDFVIMQFGHNDNGPLDEGKARASIKGNGDESREVTIKGSGDVERVHTFGWYLRQYITGAAARGATPIVCSLVPRNLWKDGRVIRAADSHGKWAREAAAEADARFIDLNELVARRYEALGHEKVQPLFTPGDHTHTAQAGAELNAACVAEGLRGLRGCRLASFLIDEPRRSAASN